MKGCEMEKIISCPNDKEPMELKAITKERIFRGVNIEYDEELFVCSECGVEAADINQAAKIQRSLADAYRVKENLLTSDEIIEGRKKLGLTQEGLARMAGVGPASIKRWEKGLIQTKANDEALRRALYGNDNPFTNLNGNRELSLPRIKRTINEFKHRLKRESSGPYDKLLYMGKYLLYADMVAFRETGKSITGATYAALPHGPQLNNYRDLVEAIRLADESEAEPLTDKEKEIIKRIVDRFPTDRSIYIAVHEEDCWKNAPTGSLIPYSEAIHLTQI